MLKFAERTNKGTFEIMIKMGFILHIEANRSLVFLLCLHCERRRPPFLSFSSVCLHCERRRSPAISVCCITKNHFNLTYILAFFPFSGTSLRFLNYVLFAFSHIWFLITKNELQCSSSYNCLHDGCNLSGLFLFCY